MLILAPWLVRSIAHVSKVPFASGDVNRGGTEKPHCVVLVTSETYDVSAALRGTQSEPGPARLDVTPRDTHIRKHEPEACRNGECPILCGSDMFAFMLSPSNDRRELRSPPAKFWDRGARLGILRTWDGNLELMLRPVLPKDWWPLPKSTTSRRKINDCVRLLSSPPPSVDYTTPFPAAGVDASGRRRTTDVVPSIALSRLFARRPSRTANHHGDANLHGPIGHVHDSSGRPAGEAGG
jgi:hypothetical protein